MAWSTMSSSLVQLDVRVVHLLLRVVDRRLRWFGVTREPVGPVVEGVELVGELGTAGNEHNVLVADGHRAHLDLVHVELVLESGDRFDGQVLGDAAAPLLDLPLELLTVDRPHAGAGQPGDERHPDSSRRTSPTTHRRESR